MDKWRPDEWFNRHTPKVMEAGFMRKGMEALANAYEDGADNMLTARDKWLVENLQRFLAKDDDGNYYLHPTKEFHEWLQSLKQSLEVKE